MRRGCGTSTAPARTPRTRPATLCSRGEPGPPPIGRPARRAPRPTCSTPPAAGADRRARRAVPRRRRAGPRLPRPARADRRALRRQPVPGRARAAAVPHRRPRPLAAGRQARVPRPPRPPGQAARLPHRARRGARDPARGRPASPTPRSWCAARASDRRLVAYAVPAAGHARSTPARAAHAAPTGCPATWCPARSWCSTACPVTRNGKLDTAALPAPRGARGGHDARARPPRRRWPRSGPSCSTSTRAPGPEDDFFALGGHSLLVLRLLAAIEERLGQPALGGDRSTAPPRCGRWRSTSRRGRPSSTPAR